ncbi:MAG: glutamate--tRNA ligase [Chloroflexi bacterium]|nr:glutamate--tRNA ligase [Chloroflexota bacterium]
MDQPVRVRYAPSPTGVPHIGNIRTALFDWLIARHTGGSFIVRIEDTDVKRYDPAAVTAILDSLAWLGLDWDEGPDRGGPVGPYFQSQRLPLYHAVAERLIERGFAYRCFCSPERLEAVRSGQTARKEPPRYDQLCRLVAPAEAAARAAAGEHAVVRFKVPDSGTTTFHDELRGDITFDNAVLDDFVMLKSDGYPTYHLAVVVDDHEMAISHVLRGEEWISSAPKHLLIYQALEWQPPEFLHLPLILGPDRSKLSKRHGATSVAAYRDDGYLPEALVNFLALLGWSKDESTELMDRDELIRSFSLERIGVTAAIFNIEKLEWMNGVYVRQLPLAELTERTLPFLERDLPAAIARPLDRAYVERVLALVQERMKRLAEAAELTTFFFAEELAYEPAALVAKGLAPAESLRALVAARERIGALAEFDVEHLETALRALAEQLGAKTGQLFGILRVAATGRTVAPPLFQTMAVLGRERALSRLDAAIARLERLS